MTGFIRRPHLFAAHVNISWCRELFDSEPKPRWLAHFSSLRHKTSPALSSSLLFYNLNFFVSLLFGCVSPSLRRPKPRQVTRSSGLETLIRKLLSFVLNISPFFNISSSPEVKNDHFVSNILTEKRQAEKIFQRHTGVTLELQLGAASVASCCECLE